MADTDTPALESPEDTVSLRDKIIRDALSKHNASQRIFSLSTEILGIILAYLRAIDPTTLREWFFPVYRRLGWLAVTHVSSRFRGAALGDAKLWTNISYTGAFTEWEVEFVKRSRSASITLQIFAHSDTTELSMDEDFLSLFRSSRNASRIRMLQTDTSMASVSFLRVIFAHTTALLQDLSIDRSLMVDDLSGSNLVTIPPLDYGWRAPSLRYLRLNGAYISWASLKSFDLFRLLVIRPEPDDYETPPIIPLWHGTHTSLPTDTSAKALLEALRALPRLQLLELSNVIPQPLPIIASSSISLPNLTALYLDDLYEPCVWLLDSIDAPQLSTVNITLQYLADAWDAPADASWYRTLLRFMALVVGNVAFPIRTIQVRVSNARLDMDVWTHSSEPDDTCWDMGYESLDLKGSNFLHIAIDFDRIGSAARCASVAREILGGLPLQELDVLRVWTDTGMNDLIFNNSMDYDRWRPLYELFWHAKSVIACGTAIVTILPLLATCNIPPWKVPGYSQPRMPLFPGLKHLSTEIGTSWITDTLDDCLEDTTGLGSEPRRDVEEDDEESESEYCARLKEAPPRKGSIDRHLAFAHSCLASRAGHAPILEYLYLALPDEEPEHGKLWESDVDALFGDVVRKLEIGIFNYFETV